MTIPVALRWGGRSHPGHLRRRNEDVWGVRPAAGVAAVADGVGGGPGGDRAALVAVDRILGALAAAPWPDRDGAVRQGAIIEAHRAIVEEAAHDAALRGMATTLAAVRWKGDRLEGVHVGDSRAYRIARERVDPLTLDHTPAGEALRRGEIARADVRGHPQGHLLLRVLGGVTAPEPDLFELSPLTEDTAILLCTDGVDAALPEDRLAQLVSPVLAGESPEETLNRLFEAALAGSAPDNLTAVLLHYCD